MPSLMVLPKPDRITNNPYSSCQAHLPPQSYLGSSCSRLRTELARKAGAHILEGSCAIQRTDAGSCVDEKNVGAEYNAKVMELV